MKCAALRRRFFVFGDRLSGAFLTADRDLCAAHRYLDAAVFDFPIADRTF